MDWNIEIRKKKNKDDWLIQITNRNDGWNTISTTNLNTNPTTNSTTNSNTNSKANSNTISNTYSNTNSNTYSNTNSNTNILLVSCPTEFGRGVIPFMVW